jgi:hypothetical protein
VNSNWLNINEDLAYRKIISRTDVSKIKSLGKYLFKTKCKWGNKVRGGDTTSPPPEGSWKPKYKMRNWTEILWKCGTVQIFWNDSNKPKFDSGGNLEEIEFG